MATNRLPSHQRMFFGMAAAGSALVAVLCFLATSSYVGRPPGRDDLPLLGVILLAAAVAYYRFEQLLSTRTTHYMLWRALLTWSQVVMVTLLAFIVLPVEERDEGREVLQAWALLTPVALMPCLALMRQTAKYLYGSSQYVRHAVFILPGFQAQTLAMRLRRSPSMGIIVDGYFDDPATSPGRLETLPYLGDLDQAVAHLKSQRSNVAFISMTLMKTPHAQPILNQLGDSTSAIYLVPESPALEDFEVNISNMAGVPLLRLHDTQILGIARGVKRWMDLLLAGAMLLVLGLPMLVIAALVRLGSPGPVLFRQTRYGLDGQPIQVMKFRSMYVHQPQTGQIKQATRGDPRITPIGRILRRTSLDELPQLLNVLNGSMSLVGPRPHAAEHNEFYRQQIRGYMLRHTVKPGITGWAQVNGLRGETDTLDKMMRRVDYDRYYIQHWSPWLDIRILFMTAGLVIHDNQAY
ncbi:UDP-glucose:undecaprenyl-phosphate glucose-1-phosphate transferase [Pigmentiphaga humi]|uniref:UDP-glucose:undecaprenyl-phosphate glucose-1-phosphate transferase n=1 Tax=Pigmentiphaga humi TaxID=2478468 RepID=A0A3P4BBW0_9BURK|nr:undecaprenyl-phosphate glucose phosphotransferase [Pigmentiphaga humi]VCU72605.1 UDP-glucose:undecaprenyl-phosphate glucose-1-phosphate transferase [Pigmentiphaga humi]